MAATPPAATATRDDLDRLAEHDAFRRPDEVAAFLESHPEVIGPLLEAVEAVPHDFGPALPMVLEPEYYPETLEDQPLSALILTDLDDTESWSALRRFEETWGGDALRRSNFKLLFTLRPACACRTSSGTRSSTLPRSSYVARATPAPDEARSVVRTMRRFTRRADISFVMVGVSR